MVNSRPARPRGRRCATGFALAASLALGCVDVSETSRPIRLEVYTWWAEGAESEAFARVLEHHRRRRPAVEIAIQRDRDGEESRDRLARHMLAEAPLGTFQANAGADLLRWAAVDYERPDGKPARESRIEPLADFFRAENIEDAFHEHVLAALRFGNDTRPFGIPIGIHRLNLVYYNLAARADFQARTGRDFATELDVLCPEDPHAVPPLELEIAVGLRSPFVLTLLVFENILPAIAGAEFYEQLWRGAAPTSEHGGPWTDDVRRAVECLKYLSQSFTGDSTNMDWAQAADRVAHGNAAFTVMGNWVDGRLADALDDTLGSVPFPRTEGVFVFTSDSFPLPTSAEHPDEVRELLKTIASPEAQADFNEKKGSIPAHREAELRSDRAVAARDDFERRHPLLATSGLFPPYFPLHDLENTLSRLVRGRDSVDDVLAWLSNAYPLLERWHQRLQEGPGSPKR